MVDLQGNGDGEQLDHKFVEEQGWGMVGLWIYRGIGMGNSWLMDQQGNG